jgi:TPR repeat protein
VPLVFVMLCGSALAAFDPASAVLIEKAKQGDVSAQYLLGLMYAKGEGCPSDSVEAAKWYHMAAELGHADAQCSVGLVYDKGEGW